MADLLPCPFCGGDAERIDFETVGSALGDDPNAGGSCVSCKRCGASSPVHFDRKENLYSSWNERAAPEAEGGERTDHETLLEQHLGDKELRHTLMLVIDQADRDLASAHAEICKLAGIDPTTHSWPAWTPQANSISWHQKLREQYALPAPPKEKADE